MGNSGSRGNRLGALEPLRGSLRRHFRPPDRDLAWALEAQLNLLAADRCNDHDNPGADFNPLTDSSAQHQHGNALQVCGTHDIRRCLARVRKMRMRRAAIAREKLPAMSSVRALFAIRF
jgi:hypothetical protein